MTAPPVAAVEHCARCASPLEEGDLRCAVCARVCDAAATAVAAAPRARILRCASCNAAVAFVAEVQAPRCGFCSAVMHVEQPVDPVERAAYALPFRVSREAAQATLRAWLGRRGWLYPKDLVSAAAVDSMAPLHWAAWIVDATATISWSADSDHGSGRSAWAPHSGMVEMSFDGSLVPASRGLTQAECGYLTARYDLATAHPIAQVAPVDGEDPLIEAFDAQRSAARRIVVDAIEATAIHRLQQGTIPGSKFRKVRVGVLLRRMRTHRVAMPAWVLAYRYRGTAYRAVIHGQDPALITAEAPYDPWKIGLLVVGGLAIAVLILVLIASATGHHR
ncbi:MAG: zinc ribbon domain-containing protein [Deltaproteobacteria bacterium]|nr:zinc ribbon domain-containing protein [Deltaproteobacteria bacterium]